MTAEVKVLIKGYVSGKGNNNTCCTISLVQDKGMNMIVDPGIVKDQKVIIEALKKENLAIKDIDYVCITHSHLDHYRNIGMFPQAKSLDYYGIWEKDSVKAWNPKFTENIEIIKTPGHDRTGITLLIKTKEGTIAICGDIFWKKNYPNNDPYASDKERLKKSRALILSKADFIIPGHDDIYKVEKDSKLLRL